MMVDLEPLKREFVAESLEDPVGLWELVKVIREKLGVTETPAVRRITLELVRELIEAGLRPGQPPYAPGGFVPWPERDPEAIIARIEREWDALGREPNIPDIVWFDNPATKAA